MKKSTKILTASLIGLAIITCSIIFAVNILSEHKFRLDDEYYAESMEMNIKKDEYEKLISDKKSFIVLVDKPGCITTPGMRKNMSEFPEDTQFKYYRIMWDEAKESSLHEYVKFVPSVAIVYKGQVKQWLQADRDEDTKYFENADDLKEWIHEYIEF